MEKSFDRIDIILICLISLCLLTIIIGVMWIILSKLEKIEIAKKGSSRLSSDTKFDKIIENKTEEIKPVETSVKSVKKSANKKSNTKKKSTSKKSNNSKKKSTSKSTNQKRKSGYVSPNKRKKTKKK